MSKTLLGISYILSAIPLMNVAGIVLLPIAWLLEGRRRGKKLWMITGVIGVVAVALGIIGMALLGGAISTALSSIPEGLIKTSAGGSRSALTAELSKVVASTTLGVTGELVLITSLTILLVFFFVMLASLNQAGRFYKSLTIRIGFILYLIWVFLTIPVIALAAASVLSPTAGVLGTAALSLIKWIAVSFILFFIAGVVTGMGFLNARDVGSTQG